MTATISAPAAPPTRTRRSVARVAALVVGTLLLLPGIGLAAGGGVLLWAHGVHRADGFVTSPEARFRTSTHALVSERIDLTTGADWLPVEAALGDARVDVTPRDGAHVFVGIAPVDDATAYLDGVARTEVGALGFDSIGDGDQRPGGAPAGPPADQDFWIAQASGTGALQVTWPATEGDWMFVIMNTDGSSGIDVDGRIGAEFPALGTIAWTVLIIGLGVTATGVLLVRPGTRRRAD